MASSEPHLARGHIIVESYYDHIVILNDSTTTEVLFERIIEQDRDCYIHVDQPAIHKIPHGKNIICMCMFQMSDNDKNNALLLKCSMSEQHKILCEKQFYNVNNNLKGIVLQIESTRSASSLQYLCAGAMPPHVGTHLQAREKTFKRQTFQHGEKYHADYFHDGELRELCACTSWE